MDKIRIQNLTVFANHGVLPEERVLGQKFLISAELYLDTRAAGMQDDLTRTVNYAQVCSFICQQMQQTFQLIEAAAEHLAQGILREYPLVRRVDLELAKPWAPVHLPVESVSVQISRSWHRAALSMGSNLGDSRAHLDAAVRALQSDPMCRSCRMSDYLVTRPVGYTEQPDFLNGAMVLDTLYTPHELLDNLQRIEQSRHRERVIHWGPRTLDLDLIFYDDRIISDARLQVSTLEGELPHPSYTWNLITEWRKRHTSESPMFILGGEDFMHLDTWHRGLELPNITNFVVVPRCQADEETFRATIGRHWPKAVITEPDENNLLSAAITDETSCLYLPLPHLDISASLLRAKWLLGESIRYLTPDPVIDILDTYINRVGIESAQYSVATAVSLVKGVVGCILVLITHVTSKKLTGEGVW